MDRDKQRELTLVARDFLRQMPRSCQWRFDVVAVYYEHGHSQPSFELFQNAFPCVVQSWLCEVLLKGFSTCLN